ncbi:uncharacterized protein TNCV_5078171 [Trichonephila clavipes]|uniref:Uncharacterized protein n=1 Tax=Trichonephila clavipes TaxID=2585209 RepID=A0A8X6RW82_TRICX|nr:uncharacterized protein TNCV_5078171 [Trichonephila clavipes]
MHEFLSYRSLKIRWRGCLSSEKTLLKGLPQGQPLKRAHYEEEVGCVCDPAFGQFGVRIEGLPDYVRVPGYNACATCYIGKNDQEAPEQYRGRYVSNPLHFTYGAYAEHPRFNGLLLKHERGDWTLEFAPEYDIDIYRFIANPQMVPFLDDPVVNMLEQGYMSKDPIDEQNVLYRQQKQDRENHNEPTF